MEKKIDDLRRSVLEIKNRTKMGEDLVQDIRSSPSIGKLYESLKAFNDRVPGVGLNAEFDAVLAEQDTKKIIDEWNEWSENFSASLKGSAGMEEAAQLADDWEEKFKDVKGFSAVSLYPEIAADLKMVSGRADILEEYLSSLTDSIWSGLGTVVIDTSEGGSAPTRRFTYFSREKDIEKKSALFRDGKSVGIEVVTQADGTYGNWSPKAEFKFLREPVSMVESIKEEIERRRLSFVKNWEREWLNQMAGIVKDTKIDVMVKEELILQMLLALQKGTLVLESSSQRVIDALNSTKRERENWYESLEYKTAFSEKIRDELQGSFRRIVERDSKFSAIAATRIVYAGVVLPFQAKGDTGSSIAVINNSSPSVPSLSTSQPRALFTRDVLPEKAQLVCFQKDGMKSTVSVVGSIESGSPKVDAKSFNGIRFGTPVFAITN
jgi:hypothetical protein